MDLSRKDLKRPADEDLVSKGDEVEFSGTDTEDETKRANDGIVGGTTKRKKKKGTKAQAAAATSKKQAAQNSQSSTGVISKNGDKK